MMNVRLIAACAVLALCVAGPFQPILAEAQQTQAPTDRPPRADSGPDAYDVGAAIMTVAGAPLKGIVCALGAITGAAMFIATFGSADQVTAEIVREGCDQRWLVLGEHIRPDPGPNRVLFLDPDPMR